MAEKIFLSNARIYVEQRVGIVLNNVPLKIRV